jgi:hypothetical protein
MCSLKGYEPSELEINLLNDLIQDEIKASQELERIIYENRKKARERYTLLHRKLVLK